jgi:hypothetical protein
VTKLPDPPAAVYWLCCQRSDVENRLQELHHGLEMGRTGCSRFLANQFRVLLALGVNAFPGGPAARRPPREAQQDAGRDTSWTLRRPDPRLRFGFPEPPRPPKKSWSCGSGPTYATRR